MFQNDAFSRTFSQKVLHFLLSMFMNFIGITRRFSENVIIVLIDPKSKFAETLRTIFRNFQSCRIHIQELLIHSIFNIHIQELLIHSPAYASLGLAAAAGARRGRGAKPGIPGARPPVRLEPRTQPPTARNTKFS